MDDSTGPIRPIGYIEMPSPSFGMPEPADGRPAEDQASPASQAPAAPGPAEREASSQPRLDDRAEARSSRAGADIDRTVRLGRGCYLSPTASVRGEVTLGDEVFVGPASSIRGDAGAPIRIGSQSNVQDGAVIHSLEGRWLVINNNRYAVYIGERVSLAHQCLVHGPAAILDGSFIGFGAVVVNSTIGRDCVIMHLAYVANVEIPDGRMVPVGAVVDTPERARSLPRVTNELKQYASEVVRANREHARDYSSGKR